MLVLGACASTGPAPVEDRNPASAATLGSAGRLPTQTRRLRADAYRVERGDTLYSIAFRHGLDYRELANWNQIGPPYTIYVGQQLRVDAAPRNAGAPSTARAGGDTLATQAATSGPAPARPAQTRTPVPAPFESVTSNSGSANSASPSSAQTPSHPTPAMVAPRPVAGADAAARATSSTSVPFSPPAPAATTGEVAWRWPADGQLVGSYVGGDPTRQGIDIAGKSGDPVRAAADGTVVYSGNGLIGYGELIIVKHSPSLLSAYGHNRKRLVKEGDHVSAGQGIAEMGSSSASRDSLHFEIRKNGKPANPLDYLPQR